MASSLELTSLRNLRIVTVCTPSCHPIKFSIDAESPVLSRYLGHFSDIPNKLLNLASVSSRQHGTICNSHSCFFTQPFIVTDLSAPKVYDYLLTFPLEISFVWPARWTAIKVLFLLTRYMPFVDGGLLLYCKPFPLCRRPGEFSLIC